MQEDLSGRRLGQYDLQAIIGRGKLATVYRAYQSSTRRTVALKAFPRELSSGQDFLTRFKREASIPARFEHPHILPIYDADQRDGYAYIAMRYLPDGSLAERLRQTPFPITQAVHIVEQIAAALDYAHQHGIVHQNVKPSNILMGVNDVIYLSDFSIACVYEAVGRLAGTPAAGASAYMSPELGAGATADPSMDIYALGIVLFEMLTGRLPFEADTPIDMMIQHRMGQVPPIRSFNRAVPAKVDPIVSQALAKVPEERFRTAGAFASALRRAAKKARSKERLPTFVKRSSRSRWQLYLLIGLAIVVGALAMGGILGMILRSR